ncbi:DUF11 domain-containing protein [Ottowia thiooxydans]|uniref:DUF11 domain-containing protein n=1 Tax=Ottowia thiooxydans TaxID=219182 RepID=UPI0003F6ED05|nr:DUF11 domain-containing protein [Ottowia thiooxydans]
MELVSRLIETRGGSRAVRKASALSVALLGICAMGGVQAAQLTCGPGSTPLRIATTDKAQWTTDARTSPADTQAATVDNFISATYGWFNPATIAQPIAAKWLSFGTVAEGGYPLVTTRGDRAKGAWVTNHATFIYSEPINIGTNVNLASIKITGRGGADNLARFSVKPATLPGGIANTAALPWVRDTALLGGSWGAPANISVDGSVNGLGFYYGDNAVGLSIYSEDLNTAQPGGVVADFEITADCLTPVAPQPTAPLSCPVGSQAGEIVRIGPFTTNARDWKWLWRTNAAGTALENVEQPLFDDYLFRGYVKPAGLPVGSETSARWISPGTTDPHTTDIPGVPYPAAIGQSKGGVDGAAFVMNQAITVGNNVDLASIKLDGRFSFDDYGNSLFVQPAGASGPTSILGGTYLPNGYGVFATQATTPSISGFALGQNTIGFRLDGGQARNDCAGGACALGVLADFYVTAACTGAPPAADLSITKTHSSANPAPGSTMTYTVVASNAGPVAATGATVTDTLPAALTNASWTCAGSGSGTCTASGSGNINDTVNLPAGASVTYTLTATVSPTATGAIANTATITPPAGLSDPTPGNNSATDTVMLPQAPLKPTPVPALDVVGLGLLGLLSAGLGGLALRRRQRGK